MDTNVASGSDTPDSCPECGGQLQINGELLCSVCGLVLKDTQIDHGPEWRSFENESNKQPSRVGSPNTETRHDRGISAEMGLPYSSTNKVTSEKKRRRLIRQRKLNKRSQFSNKQERIQGHAFSDIKRLCSSFGIGNGMEEQACRLFRTIQNEGYLVGRCWEAMTAASVYAICRVNGIPVKLTDFESRVNIPIERVKSSYNMINQEFGLAAQPLMPSECIPKLASKLDFDKEHARLAREMCNELEDKPEFSGNDPHGLAAGILYLVGKASEKDVTQTDIGDIADVTPVTIRKNRDKMLEYDAIVELLEHRV